MRDTFVQGYIAGLIGGVVMFALNLLSYSFGISESRYLDLVGVVFLGYVPDRLLGEVISQVIQLGHASFMGIAFAYLVTRIDSEYISFKGATYGAIIWFLIFGIGSLYKVPLYTQTAPLTVISHLATSSIWGIVTANVLVAMKGKQSVVSLGLSPAPALKHNTDKDDEGI